MTLALLTLGLPNSPEEDGKKRMLGAHSTTYKSALSKLVNASRKTIENNSATQGATVRTYEYICIQS